MPENPPGRPGPASDFGRYLNVRSSSGGTLRADGRRLAFLNTSGGTAQVWTLDGPGLWPEQRTFFPDRVTFVSYAPRGSRLVFGMDEGGNEQDQLYLTDDEGQAVRPLTNTPSVKHVWGGWSHDGSRLAFTATRENATDFHPYTMSLESGEVRRAAELGGYNRVVAWMPGDEAVVVQRANAPFDHDLYLVTLATGQALLLTPHEGEAQHFSVCPTPDGRSLLLLSDRGRDFVGAARLDLETLELAFLDEHPWDREGLALSEDGRTLALTSNEDGFSRLELLDLPTGRRRTVEGLPRGVFEGLDTGRDGRGFLLTATTPNEAMNVWVVSADTGLATRWTASSLGSVPREALVEPELVRFESFDGLTVPALLLRPPGATGPLPAVVIVHGGPESQSRPIFNPVAQYLVTRGYAVLLPNVRGSTGYGRRYTHLDDVQKRMDSVADLRAARDWLVREGGVDESRVAVYGGSYGGFMVLSALTTDPDLWAAGVDIVGIASFVTFLENTSPYRRRMREAEYGSLEHDREFLHSISPLTHLEKIRAPLLIVHGANDPRVPVSEAEGVVSALRGRGVPVQYLRYEDEGHGLVKLENRLDAYPKIAAFLDEHLAGRR